MICFLFVGIETSDANNMQVDSPLIESATEQEPEIVLAGNSAHQQQGRSIKRRAVQNDTTPPPAAATSLKSFWQRAFLSEDTGETETTTPPTETTEAIDSAPASEGTELVDFMDSERSKDARPTKDAGKGNGEKKYKTVLEDDEAVWGANGPIGPHYSDAHYSDDDMFDDI